MTWTGCSALVCQGGIEEIDLTVNNSKTERGCSSTGGDLVPFTVMFGGHSRGCLPVQVASKIRRKGQLRPDGGVGPPTLQARASQRLSMDTGAWTGRCIPFHCSLQYFRNLPTICCSFMRWAAIPALT